MEENVYNYVFHYNSMTKNWSAIPRDKYQEYWSNPNTPGILKSSNIKTLVELIGKGEDFVKSIKSKSRAKTQMDDLEAYRRGKSKY
jgi:hypothetical protein